MECYLSSKNINYPLPVIPTDMNANRKCSSFCCLYYRALPAGFFFCRHLRWKSHPVQKNKSYFRYNQKTSESKESGQTDSIDIRDISSVNITNRINNNRNTNFYLYRTPHLITDFNSDTNKASLTRIYKKTL